MGQRHSARDIGWEKCRHLGDTNILLWARAVGLIWNVCSVTWHTIPICTNDGHHWHHILNCFQHIYIYSKVDHQYPRLGAAACSAVSCLLQKTPTVEALPGEDTLSLATLANNINVSKGLWKQKLSAPSSRFANACNATRSLCCLNWSVESKFASHDENAFVSEKEIVDIQSWLTCKTLLPNMPLLSEPVMQCRTCRTRNIFRSCHCPNLGAAFSLLGYGFPFRASFQCTWSVRTASRAASGTSRSGGLELNTLSNMVEKSPRPKNNMENHPIALADGSPSSHWGILRPEVS